MSDIKKELGLVQETIIDIYAKGEVSKTTKHSPRIHRAVNWNRQTDGFTQYFWEKNLEQMWTDTEFVPSKDRKDWSRLSPALQDAYKKVLGGLTLLDTKQSTVGMPAVMMYTEDLQRKAVFAFMAMMEAIHSKSYSTIFTTILTDREIDDVFDWVEENQYLQFKAEHISHYYENITDAKSFYLALVASVFLESFLFYSGFFLPLWLAGGGGSEDGTGLMVASGEIIKKILDDESIHGVYTGMVAQEIYNEQLTDQEREEVDYETYALLEELMENEFRYTEELYTPISLDHEVKVFLQYNANKALMNLGKAPHYEEKKINPVVATALNTESVTHDFFSMKGTAYSKAKHRPLTDNDFVFPWLGDKPIIDNIAVTIENK